MIQKFLLALPAALLLVFGGPALADDAALIDNMTLAQRLENIAAPVLMNNPGLCGNSQRSYIGAEFLTQEGVGPSYREPVARLYNVGEWPTVTIVGQGSPADGALMHGDMVTHVNGHALPRGNEGQSALERAIEYSGEPLTLTLDRNGQPGEVTVDPVQVCNPRVRLGMKEGRDVWTENATVFVSKGAVRNEAPEKIAMQIKNELPQVR